MSPGAPTQALEQQDDPQRRRQKPDDDHAGPVGWAPAPHQSDPCKRGPHDRQGHQEAHDRQQVGRHDDPLGIAAERLVYARARASWRWITLPSRLTTAGSPETFTWPVR